jgi:hypothetical protein
VVFGHGVQPFVLSPKFFHNASASPFPIGTGEKSSGFANWLNHFKKKKATGGRDKPSGRTTLW